MPARVPRPLDFPTASRHAPAPGRPMTSRAWSALLAGGDGVDGVEVGLGRGLDDVGRGGAAAEGAVVALDFQLERHLALRVLALR